LVPSRAPPPYLPIPALDPKSPAKCSSAPATTWTGSSPKPFAHLCGPAPILASSGHTHRHRLNRGSDRGANNALYVVVVGRLRYDPPHPRLRRAPHSRRPI